MKKIVFITVLLFLLSLANTLALGMFQVGKTTYITGTVYSHSIKPGNEVPFAQVDIRCGKSSVSVVANAKGDFAAGFDSTTCKPGSALTITAKSKDGPLVGEITTTCSKGAKCKDVICNYSNTAPVLKPNAEIPEFSGFAALSVFIVCVIAFIFLRRSKKC